MTQLLMKHHLLRSIDLSGDDDISAEQEMSEALN